MSLWRRAGLLYALGLALGLEAAAAQSQPAVPPGSQTSGAPVGSKSQDASLAAQAAREAPIDRKRYQALCKIVNRHVGHAHLMRGMNRYTIEALGRAVTVADIAVLAAMMNDPDRVIALTAMNVLPTLGPEAIEAFKHAPNRLDSYDRETALQEAEQTRAAIEASRRRWR
ncbi:hypothetical protein RQP53_06860 [Paucibacter sp. APW11]|uniref:Uncharacterized protein n=1 Tax=Roseateles aquae TaxID=3077235 RepID=A0ABU3P8T9_9BURK|nr:hypothetical protein [Paucibacter sp. APW11]MDT8998986.1 hypothetical protein [Paucibacter sp. APW11]